MSYEPPTPPAELPTDIVNTLNGYSPDQLQHVARYAHGVGVDDGFCPRGWGGRDVARYEWDSR